MTLPPVEILLGTSVGLVVGTTVATLVGCGSFVARYGWNRTLPGIVAGTAAVGIAGLTASAAGVIEPRPAQLPRLAVGGSVVLVLALYANGRGERLAADLPRATARRIERGKPLTADAIDSVDAMGQVTIRSSAVRERDGYPPLGPRLRTALEEGAWRLPADLPLSELETRLEARLRTAYDLEFVSVSIDGRGRATITAAPSVTGIAKRVPDGWRAVTVRATVPPGVAPDDDVFVATGSGTASGTVLGATVDGPPDGRRDETGASSGYRNRDDRVTAGDPARVSGPVTTGGDGYVTVAVPATAVDALLDADRARVVVASRGTSPELDAISLLERGGTGIRKVTVTADVRDALADDSTDVRAFAIRAPDSGDDGSNHRWEFDPDPDDLADGTAAFLLGADADQCGFADQPTRAVPEVSNSR